MLFSNKIRNLREEKTMPQRHLADALGIDIPMYSRIERGERKAKREQIQILADVLETNAEELLSLWLADQVNTIISIDKKVATRVLELAKNTINIDTEIHYYAKRKAI